MPPSSPLELLQDALARVTSARESLGYGDPYEAAQLLEDLEHDLAASVEQLLHGT